MGLSASHSRYVSLQSQKIDTELTAQQIANERLRLTNQTNELFNLGSNLDPNSDEMLQLNMKLQSIVNIEKALTLQQTRLDTYYKSINAELESLKKIVDKTAQDLFKSE
jgi:DNA repair ATPase RecN